MATVYLPVDQSRVDELYAMTRHHEVHHMWPGGEEPQQTLRAASGLAARMKVTTHGERRDVEPQWTQIFAGLSAFGAVGEEGWSERLEERSQLDRRDLR